jgi:tRNA pseudouridine38-40 synthase
VSLTPSTDEPVASPSGGGGLVRWRLDLAYDGTDFAGWAWQRGRDLRTVQGEVERALATVCRAGERVPVVCAGRTDAGVHARGQVIHADLPTGAWPEGAADADDLVRRLNGVLPADVRVRAARVAPEGFDARFSAASRTYRYRICDRPQDLDPLHRHEVLVVKQALNVAAMNEAAAQLVGEHDFASFCRRREGASTVRRLAKLSFSRTADGLVVGTVEADAFCHSMVRSLVGALLAVGDGRRPPAWVADLLAGRERSSSVHVAPPHGLTLEAVAFPDDAQLAERAAAVRAAGPRTLPGGAS